ncbi:hypothetical protein [uncultured Mediterranean phage uvMED]|nr:hypothetical protein [uncultured Mediterranean phage uvMED]
MAYTTIDDPSAYFQTLLYTGGSSSYTNNGNSDLQPDWVWIKARNNAYEHKLFDSSRGTTKLLVSNSNVAEATQSGLTAFNSDGFSLGGDGGSNDANTNFVAWQWKANGGTTSTNTDGSQNTTVQVNSTAGFSIVKRTGTGSAGATYGHGLGAVPDVIINKGLNTNEWYSYFKAIGGGTHWIDLDGTNAAIDDANMWHDTDATSTVFTVGNSGGSNGSSVEYIAYCFKEVQGYSKFGSYTGNGSTDGTFVYTAFKPSWVMIKCTSEGSRNWVIYDNKRETFNEQEYFMRANSNGAETRDDGYSEIDLLSNGFKLRGASGDTNKSSATYIYMCFASSPFVSSEGVPTTAR